MKSEIRNPRSERNPKPDRTVGRRAFGFRISGFFRDSGFGFRVLAFLFAPLSVLAASVVDSKHNLSASGPGTIKAATETEVCIFCHTPHRAGPELPLWNHHTSVATYTPYSSSTLKASVGQPNGASKLCLSCHDGTVALGMVHSRSAPIGMQGGVTVMPAGPGNVGTDLSEDHPISFTYDAALAAEQGELRDPGLLTGKVRLDHSSQMQCTACHNPHDDQYGKFLVMDNTASALCVTCHTDPLWSGSAHRTSTAPLTGTAEKLARPGAKTVAASACGSCHTSHAAGSGQRLLHSTKEEQTCFTCHNGSVVAKNLAAEFNKASVHPVMQTSELHDSGEDPLNGSRHVSCSDCHNPHAARASAAPAPKASGALLGVKGVTRGGSPVQSAVYEYELCFRCHGDSLSRGEAHVNRLLSETNTRQEFNPANQSFHPVTAAGRNPNVPSLLPPYTTASLIRCTDCHNNDQGPDAGGSGPRGPHGSAYAPLLERQLLMTDRNPESASGYALCYKCHSRTSILADQSFKSHRKHVVDEKTACTTCHDPHGVASEPHLINFNRNYVSPSASGRLEFVDRGFSSGSCTLSCHGKDHTDVSY